MGTCAARPVIRTATDGDLDELTSWNPADADYFADRIDRQRRGLGALVVAWYAEHPVGHVYVWLEQADEPPIRQHLPGVPLLQHAWVPEQLRRRRIGTWLFLAAEDILRDRACRRVALAVEQDNGDAVRLYRRLGYREWRNGLVDCCRRRPGVGDDDSETESCRVLVKSLRHDNFLSRRRKQHHRELPLHGRDATVRR